MEIVIQTIYDLPRTAGGLIAATGSCRMDSALGGVAGTEEVKQRRAGVLSWLPQIYYTWCPPPTQDNNNC